jgi:hypothetical protein
VTVQGPWEHTHLISPHEQRKGTQKDAKLSTGHSDLEADRTKVQVCEVVVYASS